MIIDATPPSVVRRNRLYSRSVAAKSAVKHGACATTISDTTLPDAVSKCDIASPASVEQIPLPVASRAATNTSGTCRPIPPVEVRRHGPRPRRQHRARQNHRQPSPAAAAWLRSRPGSPFNADPPPPYNPPKNIERKFVNSKQISLSYDLKDVGPSGVSAIELWYTLYQGRAWNKLTEYPTDKNAPEGPKKLTFEVQDEGIYGITLVAKSGVGLGDQPPKVGDRPQFWIEVDLTKPVVADPSASTSAPASTRAN